MRGVCTDPNRPFCLHCGRNRVARPRGLCQGCHGDLAVRVMYPVSDSPHARRGDPDAYAALPVPPEPTAAPPGSEEKVEVMRRRLADGFSPHHPADAREAGDPRAAAFLRRILGGA